MLPFSLDADKTDFSMRQHSLQLWIVLLVGGVFGVDEVPVSVMEGDSVTLLSNATGINNEDLKWIINDGDIIARIDGENNLPGNQESFKGRLKLNETTGSLTITNILRSDARDYKLQIGSTKEEETIFKVSVKGVPVVDKDGVKSVSVMEGDSVTLRTGFTQIDGVNWKFEDRDLKDAIDNQTGDLTLTNISKLEAGSYMLNITTTKMILQRKFYVDLYDEMKAVSVMNGELVTLRTGLITIQKYDLLLWKYEDHLIAKLNRSANEYSLYDSRNQQFKGRLQQNEETGSLTISNSETTDSGDYHLEMSSSTYSLQRTIRVTVSNSGLSLTAVSGIIIALLVVFAVIAGLAFLQLQRKISDLQRNRRATAGERNGSAKGSDEAEGLHQDTSVS